MRSRRYFRATLLSLGTTTAVLAALPGLALTESPYQGIVARNVFALKPPPPPPSPEATKAPPPKIWLTGITTILGNKRALLKTPPPAGKPGEASKGEQYYILTEGQREGDIEVLQIDEKAGTVKVDNDGTILVLNFEKDGQKLASTPAAGPAPAIPPPTGINPAGAHMPAPNSMPGGFNMPTRPLRTGPGAAMNTGGAPVTPAMGGFGYPGGMPVGGTVGGTIGGALGSAQPAPTMTADQAAVLYEANRLKNQDLTKAGLLPRLPSLMNQQQAPATPVPTAPQTPTLPFAPGIKPPIP